MSNITKQFKMMGARVKISEPALRSQRTVRLDISKDNKGPFFDIVAGHDVDVSILDVQPNRRHLLLLAKIPADQPHRPPIKSKFLCGHDERDWFVAAVPERAATSTVDTAFEALKPAAVRKTEQKIKRKNRNRRKNEAWLRQGEWFFIPRPGLKFDPMVILYKEPLRRGRGKPHMVAELVRTGGQAVYVSPTFPNGISQAAYSRLSPKERNKKGPFQTMSRDPKVYVRGTVRHADHKTIHLHCWHEVQMNTETFSRAMSKVAFLD